MCPETEPITTVFNADTSGIIAGTNVAKSALKSYGAEVDAVSGHQYTLTKNSYNLAAAFFAINSAAIISKRLLKEFGVENDVVNRSLDMMTVGLNAVIAALAIVRAAHIIAGFAAHSHALAAFAAAVGEVSAASLMTGTLLAVAAVASAFAILYAFKAPKAQFGGIVKPRPGGTQVTVGEAGEPEAIIPLRRSREFGFGGTGGDINITMYVQGDSDEISRNLGRRLQQLRGAGAF